MAPSDTTEKGLENLLVPDDREAGGASDHQVSLLDGYLMEGRGAVANSLSVRANFTMGI